jgi:hypothetical protein
MNLDVVIPDTNYRVGDIIEVKNQFNTGAVFWLITGILCSGSWELVEREQRQVRLHSYGLRYMVHALEESIYDDDSAWTPMPVGRSFIQPCREFDEDETGRSRKIGEAPERVEFFRTRYKEHLHMG